MESVQPAALSHSEASGAPRPKPNDQPAVARQMTSSVCCRRTRAESARMGFATGSESGRWGGVCSRAAPGCPGEFATPGLLPSPLGGEGSESAASGVTSAVPENSANDYLTTLAD